MLLTLVKAKIYICELPDLLQVSQKDRWKQHKASLIPFETTDYAGNWYKWRDLFIKTDSEIKMS